MIGDYIVGGRVNWGYTGLVQKGNEWFYVKGGVRIGAIQDLSRKVMNGSLFVMVV